MLFWAGDVLVPTPIKHATRRIRVAVAAALMLSGCSSFGKQAPSATFDLTAPQAFSGRSAAARRGVLAVEVPSAIQTLDSNRIVARVGSQITYVPAAQWSDTLPSLVQTRLVQAFENSGRIASVSRTQDRITGDYQLLTEIRAFEVVVQGATSTARIEIAAKIVDKDGRVRSGRVFRGSAPAGAVTGPVAANGLNAALGGVLVDIVGWASGQV
jgi:cholesterol transport system auxiliary component